MTQTDPNDLRKAHSVSASHNEVSAWLARHGRPGESFGRMVHRVLENWPSAPQGWTLRREGGDLLWEATLHGFPCSIATEERGEGWWARVHAHPPRPPGEYPYLHEVPFLRPDLSVPPLLAMGWCAGLAMGERLHRQL